jgi:thymidylate synthase
MIISQSSSIAESWKKTGALLLKNGEQTKQAFRDERAVIIINDVSKAEFDNNFPMSQHDIEIINEFLITGENEDEVIHDWTKIYRRRLFGIGGEINQIESIFNYLSEQPQGKRAQASVWRATDINAEIAPCLQMLWFQIKGNKLEMHVHMRAVDAYGKFLMNVNEFAHLQRFLADKLDLQTGKYYHFIDTLHFNYDDQKEVEKLFGENQSNS